MTTLRTDSTHSGITIDYANGSGFVHGGSGSLTVYSDDEKAAINALTDADDDTYYLFLVNSVTKLDADGNRTIVSGYMPVGYQHGFIFEQFDVARTYAHELSHGAFALHHTFSANTESFRATEGTTNNLMDYTRDGIALNHKQWRWMHENHGKGLFGFLADESEGEWTTDGHYYLFTYLGMLMGMSYEKAEELGRYAEEPDTHVITEDDLKKGTVEMGNGVTVSISQEEYKEGDMLENTTWLYGGTQQKYHALTGGYHGVELAATVYAIKNYNDWHWEDEFKGFLLHRFGDCFAHFDIKNDAKGYKDFSLDKYTNAFDVYLDKYHTKRNIGDELDITLTDNLKVYKTIHHFNKNDIVLYNNRLYSTYEIEDLKKILCIMILESDASRVCAYELSYSVTPGYPIGSTQTYITKKSSRLIESLHEFVVNKLIVNATDQDKYKMYGDNMEAIIKTSPGHAYDTKCINNSPDEIFRRPNLFKWYSKGVIELFKCEEFNVFFVNGNRKDSKDAEDAVDCVLEFGEKQLEKYHGQVTYSGPTYMSPTGTAYTYQEYSYDYKNARLDAVWAFLIALQDNKDEFVVPIKSIPQELRNDDILSWFVYRKFNENDAIKDARNQIMIMDDFIGYINERKKLNIHVVQKEIDSNGVIFIIKR